MSGLVEEVADADCSRGLAGEVHRQGWSGTPEAAHNRIQFLAAILQVHAGHAEVSKVGRGCRDKQRPIRLVPEAMLGIVVRWRRSERRGSVHHGSRYVSQEFLSRQRASDTTHDQEKGKNSDVSAAHRIRQTEAALSLGQSAHRETKITSRCNCFDLNVCGWNLGNQ